MGFYKDPQDPSILFGAVLPCLSCEEILPGSTTAHGNSRSSEEYLGGKSMNSRIVAIVGSLQKNIRDV